MKSFLFLFTFTFLHLVQADIPPGVYTGLQKFAVNKTTLPSVYVRRLPELLHNQLIKSDNSFVSENSGQCVEWTHVEFINSLTSSTEPIINEFEAGFVKVETAHCLARTSPEKVLAILNSVEFKRKAFSKTVISVEQKDANTICEISSAPTLGESHYCYKNYYDHNSEGDLQLISMNDSFELNAKYQSGVYFRESIISAHAIGNNVLVHSINLARGPRLNTFQKLFAKSFISTTESEFFTYLSEATN